MNPENIIMIPETINYTSWIPNGITLFYEKNNQNLYGIVRDSRFYPPREGMNKGYIHLIAVENNNKIDNLYLQIHEGDFIEMETSNAIILNPLTS